MSLLKHVWADQPTCRGHQRLLDAGGVHVPPGNGAHQEGHDPRDHGGGDAGAAQGPATPAEGTAVDPRSVSHDVWLDTPISCG